MVYFGLGAISGEYISNKVDTVIPNYIAEEVGIQSGDEIISINNKKLHLKSDLDKMLEKSNGDNIKVSLKRQEEIINIELKPTEIKQNYVGIYFGAEGEKISSEVAAIYPKSVSEQSGIKVKDKILKINNEEVNNDPYKAVELINKYQGTLAFEIERKDEIINISLDPEIKSSYLLGVTLKQSDKNFANNIYYAFWDTTDFTLSIVDNLKMLFTGKVSANQLMGPIGISEVVAKTDGVKDFVYILALISLSLGVTNLLPFPPLDGGKVVILVIEAVRRKPLKENIEVGIQTAGFALIILLSIFVAYNDVLRFF